MDFLSQHLDAILSFLVTALTFLGILYRKFSILENRISQLETRANFLDASVKDSNNKIDKVESNLIARLDRIENKIDNFIQK
jgi:uncharacterized protein YlxW (UPF0749 family)